VTAGETEVDTGLAGLIAAQGFWDDPVQMWLHAPDAHRMERMVATFSLVARHNQARGGRIDFVGEDAVAMWIPPGAPAADFPDPPEELFPLFTDKAFVERLPILEAAMEAAHPAEPHWYLGIISTVPERQGTGLGAGLIRLVLDVCDRDGVASYLESSNPRNLSFYFRHGYRQIGEIELQGGPSLYPMWRDPGAGAQ
jgi:GNAT superfamily N-acetyltransferase